MSPNFRNPKRSMTLYLCHIWNIAKCSSGSPVAPHLHFFGSKESAGNGRGIIALLISLLEGSYQKGKSEPTPWLHSESVTTKTHEM